MSHRYRLSSIHTFSDRNSQRPRKLRAISLMPYPCSSLRSERRSTKTRLEHKLLSLPESVLFGKIKEKSIKHNLFVDT